MTDTSTVEEVEETKETFEKYMEQIIMIALMTPMGDPFIANCIWGLCAIFWGLSGIGKSARVQDASTAVGLPYSSLYPATKQPEDFSGAPFVFEGRIKIECILSAVRQLLDGGGRGTLFIDECSTATPAVQGAFLSLTYERMVGDLKLPGGIRILLAANPPEYAAGGWGLEAPFANRLAHYDIGQPSVRAWTAWLQGEQSDDLESVDRAEDKIRAGWVKHWSDIKGLLAGFMSTREALLHDQPTPDHPNAGRAWPSPRSWVMGGRSMAAARCLNMPKELENIMLGGCVGIGPANECTVWIRDADLPSAQQALIEGWKPDTMRLDRTVAVYTSIGSYVLDLQDKQEKVNMAVKAWERLSELKDVGMVDIAMVTGQQLIKGGLGYKSGIPAIQKAAKPLIKIIGKSGLVDHSDSL